MKELIEVRTSIEVEELKPFIRWAGGKQNLIKEIFKFVCLNDVNRYFEPFLGGASFFLKGNFTHSFLSDLNPNLINCYQQVKENPIGVYNGLTRYDKPINPDVYYHVRNDFNKHNGEQTIEQAVRFIFLNRTSFNGIYRVNRSGEYNVPFGKANPAFASLEHLKAVSQKLQNATIFTGYYDEILGTVQSDDLVYLDPPYPGLSKTAYFNHYTLDKFGEEDHVKVAHFADKLSKKGAKVIVSNADLPLIRFLYKSWNINECNAYRYISCKKEKVKVKELIIRNY